VPTTDFSNSALAGPDTMFAFLGDNFVVPPPIPFANVFSIGDVLIGAGGGLFVYQQMHGRVLPRLLRAEPRVRPAGRVSPRVPATHG
jgi:hypothetical protein